ncbi:MAG: tetratricopeptide repeat protein [Thiotrichales bacterium]|nr:tetratricopeptide repeat protein [Thiotrichales bacterium]
MSQPMIVDVTLGNVQEMVMQNSKRFPVVIHFWSSLNEQSKLANTILEKIATERAGEFILAKINVDREKDITAKFAVTDIPFYKVVKNNDIVTECAGLLTEAAYRALINANVQEEPSEQLRKQATQAFAQGEFDLAVKLLGEAAQANPNNFKVHLDLVQMYLHTGHLDKASNLLQKLPEEAQNSPQGKQVNGVIYFTEIINQSPSIEQIQTTLASNPNDSDALFGLAGFLMLNGQSENALQTLFKLFTLDRGYQDGLPQKTILKAFEMLSGPAPELVTMYRRKFQSLLY